MRRLLPIALRRGYRLLQRHLADWRTGLHRTFAARGRHLPDRYCLRIAQSLGHSALLDNKVANLRLGIAGIEPLVIGPGEVFSFWRAVGRPSARRGFRQGRNLIGGELRADTGGGLCQLAGILYHLSLLAGLEVLERHPHSRDIYAEHERYTPLGADATVVYGYKDLRIRNNQAAPLRFALHLDAGHLVCTLWSDAPLTQHNICFERLGGQDRETVRTLRVSAVGTEVLALSVYRRD
ncbi:MAG: VanW family protein [Bacteroidia bacterium]